MTRKPIREVVMIEADAGLFEDINGYFISLAKFSNGDLPFDIFGRYRVTLVPIEPEPLQPCPFCGGKASVESETWTANNPAYWVRCFECGVSGVTGFTKADAIAAWNRRA
jgi:Lar family restriction alleviation protein